MYTFDKKSEREERQRVTLIDKNTNMCINSLQNILVIKTVYYYYYR